ncbi:hypothetical protein [Symbiopectobacterium purcellii]|uniref:Uncharacterized protein n=1 Tax=Symbiopectobacterium purcellii TaxID=2871826 RepID=A0ABX9AQ88_9ENTR|nr:hypothetical protein [Symbiopectobacterium purcellii]QZN97352.1 hypothetical protein K6K13_08420 [Symbiopectobacterium purcellii]
MAKTDKTQVADEDLNAGGETTPVAANNSAETSTMVEGSNSDSTETPLTSEDVTTPQYVVLKGNHVRHDGEVYRENDTIPVSGSDAVRLMNAGVIGDIEVLRQRTLSAKPAVSVSTE